MVNRIFAIIISMLVVSDSMAFFNVPMMKRSVATCDPNNSGLVQVSTRSPNNGSTLESSYFAAQTAGNTNIVSIGFDSTTTTVSSVVDTAGNTYTLATGPIKSTLNTIYIYYSNNIVASAAGNKVTVTLSGSTSGLWLDLTEYEGLADSSVLDQVASGSGTTTTVTTGNLTTTSSCSLLYSSIYTGGWATTTGSGYLARSYAWGDLVQDRVVSSTGTYNASVGQLNSTALTIGLAAFKKKSGTIALNSIRNIQWSSSPTELANVTYQTARFHSAQTAGNLNIVTVSWYSSGGNVTSVSDTAGNTYTLASGPIRGTSLTQYVYYAKNIAAASAGSNIVTVNFDSSIKPTMTILEYKGLSTTSPLDQVASSVGTGTSFNSGSATTTATNALVLGVTKTGPHGWEDPKVGSGFRPVAMASDQTSTFVQDKVISSAGSYSSTGTFIGSADWIAHVLIFK